MNMRIKYLLLLAFVTMLCGIATAQSDSQGPIDTAMNRCLKTQKGNMLRVKCYNNALESWDKDVTTEYAAILKKMPEEQRPAFEASQRAWEKYRDAEFEFLNERYRDKHGTGYISVRITTRIDVVRPRALRLDELYAYYVN